MIREILMCMTLISVMIAMYMLSSHVERRNYESCMIVLNECQRENLKNIEDRKNRLECVVSKRCVDLVEFYTKEEK